MLCWRTYGGSNNADYDEICNCINEVGLSINMRRLINGRYLI